jgi:hypothetical protein
MQGMASEASQRTLLSRHYGQTVMALIAAVAVNPVPLDLVLTDGYRYVILRFRNDLLLVYEDLTATQVGADAFVTAISCTPVGLMSCLLTLRRVKQIDFILARARRAAFIPRTIFLLVSACHIAFCAYHAILAGRPMTQKHGADVLQ